MKLKIHTRFYNWNHIREIWAETKYVDNKYCPRIGIIFANGDERVFNFDLKSEMKKSPEEALQSAQAILDKAISEMV